MFAFRSMSGLANVSLQLTGDCLKEFLVAAVLAGIVSHLHLPGQQVARSRAWALGDTQTSSWLKISTRAIAGC